MERLKTLNKPGEWKYSQSLQPVDEWPLLISLIDFTGWAYGIFTIKMNIIFDQ
jgi:hypothetical protein